MTLNLDFSIAKAKRMLGYRPSVDFQEGIVAALDHLTDNAQLTEQHRGDCGRLKR